MFKMSYKIFENVQQTQAVFRELTNAKFDDVKSAYKVKRMLKELDGEYNEFLKMRAEVQKECEWEKLEEDEKRTPKLLNEADIKAKVESLLETEVDMKWGPLTLSEITFIKPSASDLGVLEHIADPAEIEALATPDSPTLASV